MSDKAISQQITLALCDKMVNLEQVSIDIIQINKLALDEDIPLKHSTWND